MCITRIGSKCRCTDIKNDVVVIVGVYFCFCLGKFIWIVNQPYRKHKQTWDININSSQYITTSLEQQSKSPLQVFQNPSFNSKNAAFLYLTCFYSSYKYVVFVKKRIHLWYQNRRFYAYLLRYIGNSYLDFQKGTTKWSMIDQTHPNFPKYLDNNTLP